MARILVVDDDCEILESVMGGIIEYTGNEYKWAMNGKEALEMIPDYNPAAMLIDNNMPVMTGTKLIPILEETYPRIKKILTGQGFSEEILGMGDYIVTKPCDMPTLVNAIKDAVVN